METRYGYTGFGGYASAFRRLAKRRHAMSSVSPFLCATIGFADAFLYCRGVLCYTPDDRLRLLDLHRFVSNELVISMPKITTTGNTRTSLGAIGSFRVLYYSDKILCVKFKPAQTGTMWLITFHLRTRAILVTDPSRPLQK